jgi:hypothetical protein
MGRDAWKVANEPPLELPTLTGDKPGPTKVVADLADKAANAALVAGFPGQVEKHKEAAGVTDDTGPEPFSLLRHGRLGLSEPDAAGGNNIGFWDAPRRKLVELLEAEELAKKRARQELGRKEQNLLANLTERLARGASRGPTDPPLPKKHGQFGGNLDASAFDVDGMARDDPWGAQDSANKAGNEAAAKKDGTYQEPEYAPTEDEQVQLKRIAIVREAFGVMADPQATIEDKLKAATRINAMRGLPGGPDDRTASIYDLDRRAKLDDFVEKTNAANKGGLGQDIAVPVARMANEAQATPQVINFPDPDEYSDYSLPNRKAKVRKAAKKRPSTKKAPSRSQRKGAK